MIAANPRYLDGDYLKKMIAAGAMNLTLNKEAVNSLNVFPVPDGDTGTNMSLTLQAAVAELDRTSSRSIGRVAEVVAESALMGARGNSGIILAQLLRGISRGLAGKDKATTVEVAKAFQYGIVFAYDAVTRPVEGTILTVAREIARGTRLSSRRDDFVGLIAEAVKTGRQAVEKTPEQLAVLKKAGVVDAGGLGLVHFLEGCLKGLLGEEIKGEVEMPASLVPSVQEEGEETDSIVFHYCTEALIKGREVPEKELRSTLQELGDSVIVVSGKAVTKVHVHSNHPGQVLEICLGYGSLHDIKIDNMLDQHHDGFEREARPETAPSKPLGVVAVSPGEGLSEVFRSLGVDYVVSGGQTMNPRVQDFIEAVKEVPAEKVIILPNNRNIVLAAEQARNLIEKEVTVVPTRNIPQGLAALLAYSPSAELSDNLEAMLAATEGVKAGEVTYAVRDAGFDGVDVKRGDIIGLSDGKIVSVGNDHRLVLEETLRTMVDDESEIITVFYGSDVSAEEAGGLEEKMRSEYPDLEVEIKAGGQPLYYYFVSVE